MEFDANHRQNGRQGVVTRLCSINATGLVFVSQRKLVLSSEVSFSLETRVFGLSREWCLQGWVVECRHVLNEEEGAHYQVTLLFSDMPKALQQMLSLADGTVPHAYPAWGPMPLFGLN